MGEIYFGCKVTYSTKIQLLLVKRARAREGKKQRRHFLLEPNINIL